MSLDAELSELLGPIPTGGPDAGSPLVGTAVPARGENAVAGGAFDGASKFDQLALWQPSIRSADDEIIPEKTVIDARVRDTIRNDAYVAGAAALHKDNIVGALFLLNSKPKTKVLFGKDDEVWEREFQEEVETKFGLYAESPNNWSDAKRTKTLTEFVRLAVGAYTAGGEVLASAEWMPDDGRPFRSAAMMIDADRLSTPWERLNASNIRGGVEVDRRGAPIAYHIRNAHPSEWRERDSNVWRRVMARKPWGRQMILHIFEEQRAEQTRGISAMVAALSEMNMTKGLRKLELQRAVVASTYAASLESDLPDAAFQAMGGGDDKSNPATQWMMEYLSSINEYASAGKSLLIDGQKIPVFMPGTKLKLQNPGNTGPMGDKFEQSLLRYISAILGVSYEQLSRDYTNTNYSSARASMGETWKFMVTRKKLVADKTAGFVFRNWLEEAVNGGQLETLKRSNVPNWYEGQNADAYCNAEWIGAGQGLIDPLKETQAHVLQLNNGLTTRERVMARLNGADWRNDFRQIARENAEAKTHDLVFAGSQDMNNALSGSPRSGDGAATGADAAAPEGDDND